MNRIRLDKTLLHVPKSHWSYVNARTGRRTIRWFTAKYMFMSSNEKANGNDPLSDGKVTKVRKSLPSCIICRAASDPNDKGSKQH